MAWSCNTRMHRQAAPGPQVLLPRPAPRAHPSRARPNCCRQSARAPLTSHHPHPIPPHPFPADYIALANAEHTLALSGVPVFTAANRQAAYRFVTLVDVLYEHR